MTPVTKNVYIDKLAGKANKHNNTYHITVKVKPSDLTASRNIDFNKENNKQYPKFEIGGHVRISKYKNIFARKGYISNCSKDTFVTEIVKNTVPWTYVISNLNGEVIPVTFYEKELQKKKKKNQKDFSVEKVTKRKGDKLYIKWKGYNNSFKSWIDLKIL